MKKIFSLHIFLLLTFYSCASQVKEITAKNEVSASIDSSKFETKKQEELDIILPEIKREFRAAWIATVANINWPSKKNLTADQQKQEAIYLLDLLKNNNFNAVVFQARPSADAFYKSDFEPWSYFLTGKTGQQPFPYYDPLEFWIAESHKRGLEFHVWLNPFRAHHSNGGSITSESMVRKMPNEIVRLRNGMYWYDPSEPATQNHVSKIVKDIVARYDIDGVHFDDYFYPYKEYNGGRDFPDDKSWRSYQNSGGSLSKADWRRANVNKFVERIYTEIKNQKNQVKFGISPFGIWKPGFPSDIKGTSQYDELYADAKLWLNKGWLDYFSPQLYWKMDSPGQNFNSLLNWWKSENTKNRHLWPGLNTVGVKNVTDKPTEILNQIQSIRQNLPKSTGEIHYSIAGLTNDYRMQSLLRNGPYKEPALVPKTPWLKSEKVEKPNLYFNFNNGNHVTVNWNSPKPQQVRHWVLFKKYGNSWETEILNGSEKFQNVQLRKNNQKLHKIAIKAIDQLGNESDYQAESINE